MSDGAPSPHTAVVPTGWRTRFDVRPGLRRMHGSANAIIQIVVAATAAFAFAHYVLGHATPLIAATVTISSLGLVRDARPRRVLETVIGMLVGILVAELLLFTIGSGWWQLALALALTLMIARFLSPQPAFAIAAAIQSLIVLILPAQVGAPFTRLADGLVGGVAALLVTALVPRNPRAPELRDARVVFDAVHAAVETMIQALRRGDRIRAERGLEKARGIQPLFEEWRVSLESGLAIARISPFLRRQRTELERHERVRSSMDYAIRNLRVVGRRAVYQSDDRMPRPVAADLLSDMLRGLDLLEASLEDISLEPAAREALLVVAGMLDPRTLMPDGSLGDHNLIAAMRPLVVDLLAASGMPADQARAAVPRI
ncbi:aromatic acid exporter family protein [Microbacterium sp. P02]|uniref:FUSC family protein n=1 Tax=unclassified Microbacterium TaxID=2609290 RepID=UPI00366ABBAA